VNDQPVERRPERTAEQADSRAAEHPRQPAVEHLPDHEPKFRIRARHTESTITVYQAYRPEIGIPAARDGRFPSVWSRTRMTWITRRRPQTFAVM
jgi:hypothetical protein